MSDIKICPKCNSLANWNSYFSAFICENCHNKIIPKQTNYERIVAQRTVREMAISRTTKVEGRGLFREHWYWENDAGSWDYNEYNSMEKAIQAEIEWLESEVEE